MISLALCEQLKDEQIHLLDYVFSSKKYHRRIVKNVGNLEDVYSILRKTCYSHIPVTNKEYDVTMQISTAYIAVTWGYKGVTLTQLDLIKWFRKYASKLGSEDNATIVDYFLSHNFSGYRDILISLENKYKMEMPDLGAALITTTVCDVNPGDDCDTVFKIYYKDNIGYVSYNDKNIKIVSRGYMVLFGVLYSKQFDLLLINTDNGYVVCYKDMLMPTSNSIVSVEFVDYSIERVAVLGGYGYTERYHRG